MEHHKKLKLRLQNVAKNKQKEVKLSLEEASELLKEHEHILNEIKRLNSIKSESEIKQNLIIEINGGEFE